MTGRSMTPPKKRDLQLDGIGTWHSQPQGAVRAPLSTSTSSQQLHDHSLSKDDNEHTEVRPSNHPHLQYKNPLLLQSIQQSFSDPQLLSELPSASPSITGV